MLVLFTDYEGDALAVEAASVYAVEPGGPEGCVIIHYCEHQGESRAVRGDVADVAGVLNMAKGNSH